MELPLYQVILLIGGLLCIGIVIALVIWLGRAAQRKR